LAVVGDPVNIETDVLLKMVRRQIEQLLPEGGTLTLDTLKSLGF
jgi:riboflavin synthase alpha subunit